jgi:hypothetical protein
LCVYIGLFGSGGQIALGIVFTESPGRETEPVTGVFWEGGDEVFATPLGSRALLCCVVMEHKKN